MTAMTPEQQNGGEKFGVFEEIRDAEVRGVETLNVIRRRSGVITLQTS